jgi:Fe-S-cluster-containing dehydrogenase component
MVIDAKKCVGCYNCFLTCRDEYAGNEYPGYSAAQPMSGLNWTKLLEIERGRYPHVKVAYVPVQCNHCDAAACLKLDQTGAVSRRADGIVMIDPQKAKGNKELVNLCPYRQIEWNEEAETATKCTMCAHLLDAGEPEPRCVESCPSGARAFGDLDDPNSQVSKLVAAGAKEVMHPEYGLKEKLTYLNLPRKFVAGTVILGDIDEVAIGADVTLTTSGTTLNTKTDGFGDFEFEGLPDSTKYTVTVSVAGYQPARCETKTVKDTFLGEIVLTR